MPDSCNLEDDRPKLPQCSNRTNATKCFYSSTSDRSKTPIATMPSESIHELRKGLEDTVAEEDKLLVLRRGYRNSIHQLNNVV